jgi:hypothetical protein
MNYWQTPVIKPKTWVPTEQPKNPIEPHSGQQSHFQRFMTWILHKPQDHAIFPVAAQSGRKN